MIQQPGEGPVVAQPVSPPTPRVTSGPIIETTFAFAQSCILLAAVELDLFTWIAQGKNTPALLSQSASTSDQAVGRLLGALGAMGFLQRNGDEYTLTPLSERFLVRGTASYMGDVVLQNRQEWDAWIHLSDVVRTGQSVRFINEEPLGGTFFAPLDEYLFPLVHPLMHMICRRLGIGEHLRNLQVLDLGAGTAPGAIAALELDPGTHAIAMDFPEVLAKTEIYARKHGVASRMEYEPANIETVELPAKKFDLIIASHVFRVLGAEKTQRLLAQCSQSLLPGGRLVVVETYNEQGAKLFPYIVSLNMLVNTRSGDAFTSRQMHEWLASAGLEVETWSNVGPDPVLIATRS